MITKETSVAIYSFSTSVKRPSEDKAIQEIKDLCERKGLNFSRIVVQQLQRWIEERNDGQK